MSAEQPNPLTAGLPEDDLGSVLREYMAVAGRLQQTHEALQSEIVRLRQELASKDRELELRRRLAALGELAAGVAHEVRNPLGAIQLYSNLLRKHCHEHKLDPALRLVDKIEAGIQAIDAVVQDTLALAPRDRKPGVCHLKEVIERARDAALPVLTARGVTLELHGNDPAWRVQGDENGLQRVLVNLIVNAAEVSPPGAPVVVRVGADGPDAVAVQVCDRGPGLADEIRERIFDPFFTTKKNGTGLGLTIAHRLIEAFGGRLTAGNRPDGGAEFVITLPRVPNGAASDGQEAGAQQTSAA